MKKLVNNCLKYLKENIDSEDNGLKQIFNDYTVDTRRRKCTSAEAFTIGNIIIA